MPEIHSHLDATDVSSPGEKCAWPAGTAAVPGWADAFTAGRFALFLGLLLAANFAPVLFGGQSFYLRDFGYFSYPLAQYHRECFWRGELPLWNPYNSCGLPFLAQWNTLALYPPALIYLLLPMPWSFNLYCVVHLFFAGLGMYALAQHWVQNRFAASVAGMLFAFSGLALNCLMWSNNVAALALMPWVVLCAQRAWQHGRRQVPAGIFVGALQMLAGAPEITALTWLFVIALAVLEALTGDVPPRRLIARLGAVIAFVAALSAAQLLPFFDLLQSSDRNTRFATAAWSMPSWGLANLCVPLFHSYPTPAGIFFQRDQYWVASYYLGIIALALGGVAVWRVRHPRVFLLVALSTLSVLLALGDNAGVYSALRQAAPQLGFMRFPIKFIVLFSLALPLLAAFGVRWMEEAPLKRIPMQTLATVAGALGIIILGFIWMARAHPVLSEVWSTTAWSGASRLLIVACMAALLIALTRIPRDRSKQIIGAVLLLLIFVDGKTHSPRPNPTIPSGALQAGFVKLEPPPSLAGNRAMLTRPAYEEVHSRSISDPMKDFLLHRQTLFDNCNLYDHIPKTDGFFSLYPREQREIWAELWMHQTNYLASPMLDFLGVAHVNTPGDVFEWTHRPSALPLATAGQQPVFAGANATLDALLAPSFDSRRTVFLPPDASPSVRIRRPTEARILAQSWTAQKIEFQIAAKEDSLLVLAQTFDRSWRARVDGQSAELLRANHAFQAIVVPAGTHAVTFRYESRALRTGLIISMLALALTLAGAWWNPRWI